MEVNMSEEKQVKTVAGGCGPNFEVTDLPEPPRDLNFKKLFAILGPAVIALGGTIGGGEWLVGPSLFVKWGLALLWITTTGGGVRGWRGPHRVARRDVDGGTWRWKAARGRDAPGVVRGIPRALSRHQGGVRSAGDSESGRQVRGAGLARVGRGAEVRSGTTAAAGGGATRAGPCAARARVGSVSVGSAGGGVSPLAFDLAVISSSRLLVFPSSRLLCFCLPLRFLS